jgi:hypothetical protein
VVLLVPVMLFLLGVPMQAPSVTGTAQVDVRREVSTPVGMVGQGPNPWMQISALAVALDDPLARGVPITVNGKPASFGELETGMSVVIEKYPDQRLERKYRIEHIIAGEGADKVAPSDLKKVGVIDKLDAKNQVFWLKGKPGDKEQDLQYDLVALGLVEPIDFKALESLAQHPTLREQFNGKMVEVVGQYAPTSPQLFMLARHKRQCCAGDAVQLSVPILAAEEVTKFQRNDWIRVIGRVEFREQPGRRGLMPMLRVARKDHVTESKAESNPFID